jgi:hypothetical protein
MGDRRWYARSTVDDIARQLAARDRLMRRQSQELTPDQRLSKMWQLQQASWERLHQSPKGYAHFIRRNFKARAITPPPFDPHANA